MSKQGKTKQNKGPFLFFKNIRSQKNRNGPYLNSQALIIVLIVMAITFTLAAAFLAFSRTSYRINQAGLDSTRAYYLAYSGIEIARSQLEAGFDSYQGGELNCSGGTITITVAAKDTQDRRRVTSLGRFNNLYQGISKTYQKTTWRDVCWVADFYNNRVVKLKSDGTPTYTSPSGSFSYPNAVSVNPTDGSCWVADWGNGRVVKLKSDGTPAFSPLTGFVNSRSVSVNPTDGSCWVADSGNNRVVKLKSDGTPMYTSPSGSFSRPYSVSVNPTDGSCWVADYGNNRVVRLKSDGTPTYTSPSGSFSYPNAVSVNPSDGSCWVADFGNGRVVTLNSNGTPTYTSPSGYFSQPRSVSANPTDGSCWVADWLSTAGVVKLSSSGTPMYTSPSYYFSYPQSVSVNPSDGSCWVADSSHNRVVEFSSTGEILYTSTEFSAPLFVSAAREQANIEEVP